MYESKHPVNTSMSVNSPITKKRTLASICNSGTDRSDSSDSRDLSDSTTSTPATKKVALPSHTDPYKPLQEALPTKKSNKTVVSKQKPIAVVVHADELDFEKHVYMNPVYNNKAKGFKLVKVHTSIDNPNPLRIQFTNVSGRIPRKFGVDVNTHGKTYLTFAIPCEKEYNAMVKFQEDTKEYAKKHKHEWWSYAISDNQIDDNCANFVSAQKEKTEGGGHWPGNMKVNIPLDDDGEAKQCRILDEYGNDIPIHELPGRKWDSIMIEISGIYFQNRFNWGFGPKSLCLVRLAEDDNNIITSDVDYLDISLAKRE